ncbi:D-glycero-beta-D-manno-heptose-7-phosphate kinase [Candidatus Marinamargulisbacteria bacterium SCGC AG-410-N11]|nr:D-glycero-beta-D-manno-heptose-7-phosphate kinase [Candidatus Marinamargulisbacteria bacterium SCGC AG-410-N11]
MERAHLLNCLDSCEKNIPILVIGDVMLDEYHWCDVSRISPEAPVPVCKVNKTTLVPGGAANVALNISTLNGNSYLVGCLGDDSSGLKLQSILKQSNINIDGVFLNQNYPTILKSRIIAHHQHVVRVDRESNKQLPDKFYDKFYSYIEQHIQIFKAIILSDYLKGTLSNDLLHKLICLAKNHNIPVIVDPKGNDYSKYKNAFVLTPNFSEFQSIASKEIMTEEDIFSEGVKIIKKLNLNSLIVTRSEKGLSIITPTQKTDISTKAKDVFDITGAGDTFISMLTLGIAANLGLKESAFLANQAAGIVVGKIGTSTTTLDDIRKFINSK